MPTITQMTYIMAVHKLKHFGKAAESCFVSQPSLSAQIQAVEKELGIVLFDRAKKPVRTTQKGEDVIRRMRATLEAYQGVLELKHEGEEVSGDFSLGVIPTLAPYVLPLFVEAFSKRFPKVNMTISELKTSDIVQMLKEDTLDAGLLVTPLNEPLITEAPLCWEPFYVFVSVDHPLYTKTFVTEKDLDTASVWLLDEGHCFRDQVMKICKLEAKGRVLQNVSFSSGSLETLINLIRNGRGYTLLPHLATRYLTEEERRLNLKPFKTPVPTREISLVFSRPDLKKSLLQALKTTILEYVPSELYMDGAQSDMSVVDL